MPEFKLTEVAETPYLYVEKSCSMDPGDISNAMGASFAEVWDFMQANGIAPAGGALAVYYSYDPERMDFRAGFIVRREEMARAAGNIKADVTPAGQALHFVHQGSYATLRDDYAAMMQHVSGIGREVGAPTWEIYPNDPGQVPEAELLTEVYSMLR